MMEILCGTKASESGVLGCDGGEVMVIKPRYVLNSGFNNQPEASWIILGLGPRSTIAM
jgi:hypothetical protein